MRSNAISPGENSPSSAASSTESGVRPLNTVFKCDKCRQDRKKCERPDRLQKCRLCAQYNFECGESRVSNRALRGHGRSRALRQHASRSRHPPTSHRPHSTRHDFLTTHPRSRTDTEVSSVYVTPPPSSRSSRSTPSFTTPSPQQCLPQQQYSSTPPFRERQDSIHSFTYEPEAQRIEGCRANFQRDFAQKSDTFTAQENLSAVGSSQNISSIGRLSSGSQGLAQVSDGAFRASEHALQSRSGLTGLQPSRDREMLLEAYLEHRVARLWDSDEAFAMAAKFAKPTTSRSVVVTALFSRTFSELFRSSRNLAKEGHEMVKLVRYACGAADAYMNSRLPETMRAEFLKAYNRYDSEAQKILLQAVYEFDGKVCEGSSHNVWPLYIATFLHHAAGACIRGHIDVEKALAAFEYYDKFTAIFPIMIRPSPRSDGKWAVDMLLANNRDDPGMRIDSLMFALGKVRLKFDREEGLC